MTPLSLVMDLLHRRPPTLGAGRLLCVDGPAGSGKSSLAQDAAETEPGSRVVHMDDLYPGWSGLPVVDEQLDTLLRPLATGRAGSYRRYDWTRGEYAETVTVDPVPLLVLEGVGSGASRFDPLCTVLVWVEAPYDVRLRRGLARDGDTFAPHWEQWAQDESELFTRECTHTRADVVIDGTRPWG